MTRKKIHPAPKIKNVQVQGLRLIPQYFLDQPPRPTPVTFQRYHTLSYKLRCYTRISSPEKSPNNTREKIRYLFTCVWHRQSAADTSLAFHSLVKSTFLVSKGLLCLFDKQNNIWARADIKVLFSCSTRHLTCSLRLLVSYRVKHSKRNSISARAHVLSSISL